MPCRPKMCSGLHDLVESFGEVRRRRRHADGNQHRCCGLHPSFLIGVTVRCMTIDSGQQASPPKNADSCKVCLRHHASIETPLRPWPATIRCQNFSFVRSPRPLPDIRTADHCERSMPSPFSHRRTGFGGRRRWSEHALACAGHCIPAACAADRTTTIPTVFIPAYGKDQAAAIPLSAGLLGTEPLATEPDCAPR